MTRPHNFSHVMYQELIMAARDEERKRRGMTWGFVPLPYSTLKRLWVTAATIGRYYEAKSSISRSADVRLIERR
jgi:hypothetical protein